jgi:hypothetical protein
MGVCEDRARRRGCRRVGSTLEDARGRFARRVLRARDLGIVGLRERRLEVQRRLLATRDQRLALAKRRRLAAVAA